MTLYKVFVPTHKYLVYVIKAKSHKEALAKYKSSIDVETETTSLSPSEEKSCPPGAVYIRCRKTS